MGSSAPEPTDAGGLEIGRVIADRYRITGVLGIGGMGCVYRGEHTGMGKPVAVKVLHAALGRNQEAAIRFKGEAIASGRLDHPNIISVMDFGVLDDDCLYLVMEALEGEHLGQRLARHQRMPWPDALVIVRGVLLGLHHAHDRGVVHRDIKPDNLFLANKGGEQIVKILDFGIAKLYAENTEQLSATRDGVAVGTPTYLSPEQAVGGDITPACDVYSTSVVLYELLAGRAPFESEDPLKLLMAHATGEVPTFSEIAPTVELPDGLEALIRRGLAKSAAERIGSALEYVQAIDEILSAHGVAVAIPGGQRSQPVRLPTGGHALVTPTPSGGRHTPTPGARTSPRGVPATSVASTGQVPAPASAALDAVVVDATGASHDALRRRRVARTWLAVGALVLAATFIGGGALLLRDRTEPDDPSPTARPAPPEGARAQAAPATAAAAKPGTAKPTPVKPAAVTPAVGQPTAAKPAGDELSAKRAASTAASRAASRAHSAKLAAALKTLRVGKTCAARKRAIPRLVALDDPKAIPALKKARARGAPNACLRTSATAAIKKLAN